MSTQASPPRVAPDGMRANEQALFFQEVPALIHTARDALENHYVGTLSLWLLGAAFVSVLVGAILYFLAVSPSVIRVLGPLLSSQ